MQLFQMHSNFGPRGIDFMAFLCNQFQNQEPGTTREIEELAKGKNGAKFTILEKIYINDRERHKIYDFFAKVVNTTILIKCVRTTFQGFLSISW